MRDFSNPLNRRTLLTAIGGSALGLSATSLNAQANWPDGLIKLVTPTPTGVGIDPVARLYAEQLGKITKTAVIVENKPGAGGMLGADVVAKAPPNGQTLLMTVGATFTTTPYLYPRLPYNPQKDFVPIAQLYGGGSFLIAKADFPANSVKELVALAKQKPRSINYASYGPGSTSHLFMEQIQKQQHSAGLIEEPSRVPKCAGHCRTHRLDPIIARGHACVLAARTHMDGNGSCGNATPVLNCWLTHSQ